MGLGTDKAHVVGRNQRFFAKAETTQGTFIKPLATDAIKVQQTTMKNTVSDEPIDDNSDYRYHTEMIQDKEQNTWSLDAYLIPSGTPATEPDLGPVLKAGMGADNAGAGSEWIYTVASIQNWPTLSLIRHFNNVWMESMRGCLVDKLVFKMAGGAQPTIHAEGRAMGYALTGPSVLNGAMIGSATMVVATADSWMFHENSVVKIDTDDNSGAGYMVTVDSARPSFTIEAVASGSNGQPVIPFVPSPTYVGSPISGVNGTFAIDAGDVLPVQSVEITLENNHDLFEDEIFQQRPSDFVPGKVDMTVVVGLRMRQDRLVLLGNPRAFTTYDLAITTGNAAGRRYTFDIDYGQPMIPDITVPKDVAGTAQLTYKGIGSGANGPLIITAN